MVAWTHNGLAEDLATHLKADARMVWLDIQLGPAGSPRPDVYTMAKSFMRPCPTAYECKISRSDFRADVTVGKWHSYLDYAHAVVFAVPAGLIDKREVPDMCGLIVRHENSWRLAKKSTINPHPIDQNALIKLIIDGVRREGAKQRHKDWSDHSATRRFAQKFGATAARYCADIAGAEQQAKFHRQQCANMLEAARKQAKGIVDRAMKDTPELWRTLTDVLGLPVEANEWNVRDAISLLRGKTGSLQGRALKELLKQLQQLVYMHTPKTEDDTEE